jgi:hypothetical protein
MTKITVLLLLTVFTAIVSAQAGCKFSGKDDKGDFYMDLNVLAKDNGYAVPGDSDYSYVVNFCKGVNQDCKSLGKDYKAIQVAKNPALPVPCYYLSSLASSDDSLVKLYDPKNPDAGVVLNYQQGEPFIDDQGNTVTREAEIQATCDPKNDDSKLSITHLSEERRDNQLFYMFKMTAAAACPNRGGPAPGGNNYPLGQLGIGGLLMIIAAAAGLLYFVVGAAVMKFKFQKTGIEIIPNVHIWKECFLLPKDGVLLIVDGVKRVLKRGEYKELRDP